MHYFCGVWRSDTTLPVLCTPFMAFVRVKTTTKRDSVCFIRIAGEFYIVDDGLVEHGLASGG